MGSIKRLSEATGFDLADSRVRGRWWIDDKGEFVEHFRVGEARSSQHVALRLLGMIEVIAEKNAVRVRWDVSSVSHKAIVSAAMFLSTRHVSAHVTLEFFWAAWNREYYSKNAHALSRISELATFRNVEPFKGVKRCVRPLSSVHSEGDLIWKSFELWNQGKGYFTKDVQQSLGHMSPYALSFRLHAHEDRLVFDHIGDKSGSMQVFGHEWAKNALGQKCNRTQPDYEFDDRVCDAYMEVLESGEPMVDHIRAIVRRDGGDPVWVPYRRLVLPTKDRFGAPLVLSICDVRQDLAIPFMAAERPF